MKTTYFPATLVVAAAISSSGCTTMIAGAMAVSTPDEIKRSQYVTTLESRHAVEQVTACLKQALLSARNGSKPAQLTYRDTGAQPYQFVISNGASSSWSGMRPELLALLEASSDSRGGSATTIWAHPYLLSGAGPQGYLANTVDLARPCM